jgi:methylthioribulose-1-phosphate dehydratase
MSAQLAEAAALASGVPPGVADLIVQAGRRLDARGWVPATAGNISMRLDAEHLAITRSGVHKGFLSPADVIVVDLRGAPRDPAARPSAETLLHCQLYARFPAVGAVLHGHSVPGTVLSMREARLGFRGYEVQKVFEGQTGHELALDLPMVDNDQDIARLARTVAPLLDTARAGYLIRGHGSYVWAADMHQALARFEGLEFLLSCELERRSFAP